MDNCSVQSQGCRGKVRAGVRVAVRRRLWVDEDKLQLMASRNQLHSGFILIVLSVSVSNLRLRFEVKIDGAQMIGHRHGSCPYLHCLH